MDMRLATRESFLGDWNPSKFWIRRRNRDRKSQAEWPVKFFALKIQLNHDFSSW